MNSSQSQTPQPPKTGSNTALIIIIVIIAALVVLGAGGYFVWKYYLKAKITSTASQTSTTPSTTTPSTTSATPSSTSTTTGKTTISTDYVIADSNTRIISESELIGLTPWELKVARNEIYARHGREFVHKDLQCYFATKSWYHIDPNFSETMLTQIENKNVATILAYEQKINSPLLSKDTGC